MSIRPKKPLAPPSRLDSQATDQRHHAAPYNDDDGSDHFPESLKKLLDPIKRATTLYRSLLAESQRQEIRDYALANLKRQRNLKECYNDVVLFANSLGDQSDPINPEFVGLILDEARKCDENLYFEASYNMQDDCNPLVTVVPCTTASLVADFKVHDVPADQVDFAIALEPGRTPVAGTAVDRTTVDKTAADRIEARRRSMPGLSINHTDYAPILHRPIAISVETKRTNNNFGKAKVQLIVCLASGAVGQG
ncbi:hypothetical protein F4803DRAFT_557260 [Xylaria telfairii]|nr:hypothetical protein F4803DRAFT_557260 [Xylaria telfairii]